MLVGVLAYESMDLLDAGGPIEVLLTASRLAVRAGDPPPFQVVTVGVGHGAVTTYGGTVVLPTHSVGSAPPLDVLVVPGAIAIGEVTAQPENVAAVRALATDASIVASVCTGAFLLHAAGLLGDHPWTTHWEDIDALAHITGSSRGVRARWVDAGGVVTSGGISSGLAMALHLVDRLAGRGLAQATARQIDYVWDPADGVAHTPA